MTARIINLAKFKAERDERDRRSNPFALLMAYAQAYADLFSIFWRT